MARVVFLLKGYPRLSETFIAQEILALEKRGLNIDLFSLRKPTDKSVHPIHKEIRASITYLPEYLYQEPLRTLRAWKSVRHLSGFEKAYKIWRADLIRDPSPNRMRRFGQALVLANELPPGTQNLHAHFLHTPTSVARYAAIMSGLPFTISAHAKDIWTIPEWEIREKLNDCSWLVTCTAAHRDHLAKLAPPERIHLAYHGLDFSKFPIPDLKTNFNEGKEPRTPVIILSVGRLVEKKGYDILLRALASLPQSLHWHFEHAGSGPLARELRHLARTLHIADRIHWHGALPQTEVLRLYRSADLFVLASRISRAGDRDGLPNVLMEAQSQSLPCISTDLAGIKEIIEPRQNGLIVNPNAIQPLADAITKLIRDPKERSRLGRAGEQHVRTHFSVEPGIEILAKLFGINTSKPEAY